MNNFRKIDIYVRHYHSGNDESTFVYMYSTHASKTCKEAKARFIAKFGFTASNVKCNFAK